MSLTTDVLPGPAASASKAMKAKKQRGRRRRIIAKILLLDCWYDAELERVLDQQLTGNFSLVGQRLL